MKIVSVLYVSVVGGVPCCDGLLPDAGSPQILRVLRDKSIAIARSLIHCTVLQESSSSRRQRRVPLFGTKTSVANEFYVATEAHLNNTNIQPMIDKRPHEQRVSSPRKARRLNHPFQHLYRHSDPFWDDNDWSDDDYLNNDGFDSSMLEKFALQDGSGDIATTDFNSTTAQQPINQRAALSAVHYLHVHGGYSIDEIQQMHEQFPPLLETDTLRHLRPKMRFLKDCLDGGDTTQRIQVLNPQLKSILPANFFGARFERTIAPRHAFLVHLGLPSGRALWDDSVVHQSDTNRNANESLFGEFLLMHRNPKQFAAMCNKWRSRYGSTTTSINNLPITSEQIVAFDKLFQRGLLSAARDDSAHVFTGDVKEGNKGTKANHSTSQPSLMQTANVTSAQLVRYLIQHGGNPYEEDVRGASLFHWSAGCGNLDGLRALVQSCDQLQTDRMNHQKKSEDDYLPEKPGIHAALLWKASRDHATPYHWAAAGAAPKQFGIGGHPAVCAYLSSLCTQQSQILSERKLINAQTKDKNTILMWAAWSRSLDVVKLLVRNRATTTCCNRNGCTVAHWAGTLAYLSFFDPVG